MSQNRNKIFYADDMQIERLEVNEVNSTNSGSSYEETRATAGNSKYLADEVELQRVIVKEEMDDSDSEGEECYIFADDMGVVQMDGDLPYIIEDPNNENSSSILLIDPLSTSEYATGTSNDQEGESDGESQLYIEVRSPKKSLKNKPLEGRFGLGDHCFKLKNSGIESVGNKSTDYDSEMVIYPVKENVQDIEGSRTFLQSRKSAARQSDRNNWNGRYLKFKNPADLMQMKDTDKIIYGKPVRSSDTHPYRCDDCGEVFELKSHFVMHELGHEKYKFYSFRTNTMKCICAQCKKPYLYSANDRKQNSKICISCVMKLRERMSLYSSEKENGVKRKNGVKRFVEFSERNSGTQVNKKQCYSCGRRSDRYFVYGASLLCSQCWQDRTRRAKRSVRSARKPSHGSYQQHNSACAKCVERFPLKSKFAHFRCEHAEETSNLLGTHFLLSAFDAASANGDEDKDSDCEEPEDWKQIGVSISECEEESDSNTVVLCERTGKFIDPSS